jgi:NDP-sugar pyrophosphorylase family protein
MIRNVVSGARVHGIVLAGAYPRSHSALDQLGPRPLLPVAQRPLVTYALRWMRDAGLDEASVCANSAARAIRGCLARDTPLGMRLDYMEDWTPRGTAGCVRDAGMKTGALTFVVVDGTTVPVIDLPDLLGAHVSSGAAMTVVVSSDARSGPNSPGALRPGGIYVFDRRVFEHIPEDGFQDIKEKLVPRLDQAGERVWSYTAAETCPRVVSAETYLALNQWAIQRSVRDGSPEPGFSVRGEALVHESAGVHASARLLGPVILGPKVSVGPGATVIGPATIGAETRIGEDAVVSRSVLWNRCTIGEGAFVDRSLLADAAVIGNRQSLFAAMKVGETRPEERPARPGQTGLAWTPITAALRPRTSWQL